LSTSRTLDNKFQELEMLLLSGGYEQARARTGVPFIILLYPPEEEVQTRRRISTLAKKLESHGWKINYFEPEPLLFEFLESKGKSKDAFEAERKDPNQLRSNIAADLFVKKLTDLGKDINDKSVILVRRAGGFYPHVNIHSLQERLVNGVKMTTVFFIPAIETEGNHYLYMGKEKTQKYRGHYI
jgi:hypothetical protein